MTMLRQKVEFELVDLDKRQNQPGRREITYR